MGFLAILLDWLYDWLTFGERRHQGEEPPRGCLLSILVGLAWLLVVVLILVGIAVITSTDSPNAE